MAEIDSCSTCKRPIIWRNIILGETVACDPTLRKLSELPLGGTVWTTLVSVEGRIVKKEFAHTDAADAEGYMPHFYTCDVGTDKACPAAYLMDRKYLGDPSVGPLGEGEGGGGELP